MYGKIFSDIFDSSLIAEGGWIPTYIFMSMISLADKDGVLRHDPRTLYRKLGMDMDEKVSFDEFVDALEYLESPDDLSNISKLNGRRIVALSSLDEHDGNRGWLIVNYQFYRDKGGIEERRKNDAARQARKREKEKINNLANASPECHVTSRRGHGESLYTDTDTDTDKNIKHTRDLSSPDDPPKSRIPVKQIVDLYHRMLPDLPRVEKVTQTRRGYIKQRWREDLPTLTHWENYFDYVSQSDFLMGRKPGREGRPPFIANLEWITKPANFAKISEEQYHRG